MIRIYAASVNDWDNALLLGDSLLTRLMNGITKPKIKILGSDVAGRVESVGKNVKKFKPGDEVYGDLSGRWGGFAEYAAAHEKMLTVKPKAMTFEEAAAIPQAAELAIQGLMDKGQIQPGQKILINGAGGGVGTFGIQLARQYDDVEVTGVDSAEKLDMMRSLGFDYVIDYKKEDFTKTGKQYDLILDTKTSRSPFKYAQFLSPKGKYTTVGGSIPRLLQSLLFGPVISLIYKKQIRIVALKQNKDLDYVNELYEAGKFKPIIDGPYKLEETPEAFEHFRKAKHKGKIVITI